MKKTLLCLLILLTLLLSSCSLLSEKAESLIPTADIEETLHWMIDDAMMAVSTQLMYELRMEMSTRIPDTPTPTHTYVVPVEMTPTMTSIWQGQHQAQEYTATPTPENCINRVKFVEDITIPDGTIVTPGKPFTKTWKLQNTGTCVWTDGYSFQFIDGDLMGANTVIPFPRDTIVRPNETFEISVYMTAPETPGRYQGNWKITTPYNMQFGTGDNGEKSVWVKIEVR